jgi:hypothetical protein
VIPLTSIRSASRLVLMLNATFNNISVISWRSFLLVGETGVPGENQLTYHSHWQTFSHNVVSSTSLGICKSFLLPLVIPANILVFYSAITKCLIRNNENEDRLIPYQKLETSYLFWSGISLTNKYTCTCIFWRMLQTKFQW